MTGYTRREYVARGNLPVGALACVSEALGALEDDFAQYIAVAGLRVAVADERDVFPGGHTTGQGFDFRTQTALVCPLFAQEGPELHDDRSAIPVASNDE